MNILTEDTGSLEPAVEPEPLATDGSLEPAVEPEPLATDGSLEPAVEPEPLATDGSLEPAVEPEPLATDGSLEPAVEPEPLATDGSLEPAVEPEPLATDGSLEPAVEPEPLATDGSLEPAVEPEPLATDGSLEPAVEPEPPATDGSLEPAVEPEPLATDGSLEPAVEPEPLATDGSLETAVEPQEILLEGSDELLPAIDPNAVVIDDDPIADSIEPIAGVESEPPSDLFNLDELENRLEDEADINNDGLIDENDFIDEDGVGIDLDGQGGDEDNAIEVPASAGSEATFRFSASNTSYAQLRVGWQFSSVERPKFEIVAPDGTIYNSNDPSEVAIFSGKDADPDYAKVLIDDDVSNSRQLEVIVMEPEVGDWTIRMLDTNGLGMTEYSAELPMAAPSLDIGKPTFDPATGQVTIPYEASDVDSSMTVKFYYDSDGDDGDGVPISDDIVLGSGSSSSQFVWNATDLPSDEYYIFARVEDANSAPVVIYANEPVEIVEAGALPAVQNVGASWIGGNEVAVSWDGIPEAQSYLVSYSSDASSSDDLEEETVEVAGGLDSIILSDLTPGETYSFTVEAVDVDDDYSPESDPALATVGEFTGDDLTSDTADDEEWDVFAEPGTTYTEDLPLEDVVEVEAIDIPEGAELNLETGKLTWAVPAECSTRRAKV